MKTPDAMSPMKNYDFTEITRLLLKMRDNCVSKEGEAYDDPERKEKCEALEAAIDLINNPSMLQRWISVEERLPEKKTPYCQTVIVCTEDREVLVGFCNHGKWYVMRDDDDYCDDADDGEITHWMPLPEPPEEEE